MSKRTASFNFLTAMHLIYKSIKSCLKSNFVNFDQYVVSYKTEGTWLDRIGVICNAQTIISIALL